jgi:hypothetical protein
VSVSRHTFCRGPRLRKINFNTYLCVLTRSRSRSRGIHLSNVFYAFCAWWIYFPQSGALAEGTSRPVSHKHDHNKTTTHKTHRHDAGGSPPNIERIERMKRIDAVSHREQKCDRRALLSGCGLAVPMTINLCYFSKVLAQRAWHLFFFTDTLAVKRNDRQLTSQPESGE